MQCGMTLNAQWRLLCALFVAEFFHFSAADSWEPKQDSTIQLDKVHKKIHRDFLLHWKWNFSYTWTESHQPANQAEIIHNTDSNFHHNRSRWWSHTHWTRQNALIKSRISSNSYARLHFFLFDVDMNCWAQRDHHYSHFIPFYNHYIEVNECSLVELHLCVRLSHSRDRVPTSSEIIWSLVDVCFICWWFTS